MVLRLLLRAVPALGPLAKRVLPLAGSVTRMTLPSAKLRRAAAARDALFFFLMVAVFLVRFTTNPQSGHVKLLVLLLM